MSKGILTNDETSKYIERWRGGFPKLRRNFTIDKWISLFSDCCKSGISEIISKDKVNNYLHLLNTAKRISDFSPQRDVFLIKTPGRYSDFGNHIDLKGCGGPVVGTTTEEEIISVVQSRSDGKVILNNTDPNFSRKVFTKDDIIPSRHVAHDLNEWDRWTAKNFKQLLEKGEDLSERAWDKYIKGLIILIQDYYRDSAGKVTKSIKGITVLFNSNLTCSGGKSSSSALVINIALGLDAIYDLSDIPKDKFIDMVGMSEWYVMTRGGCADHARIVYSKKGHFVMVNSFPTQLLSTVTIPQNIVRVIINCGVDRPQDEVTRNIMRVSASCFPLAVLCIKHFFPSYKSVLEEDDRFYRLGFLREFTPLGKLYNQVPLILLYNKIIRSLPEKIYRGELFNILAEYQKELKTIFSNHYEPQQGYRIRDAAVFGLSEIERTLSFMEACRKIDIRKIMELTRLSHDGDRVTRFVVSENEKFKEIGWDYHTTDQLLDRLVSILEKDPWDKRARLYMQPGRFERSISQMDRLADIVSSNFNLDEAAIRIMGAGKGGEMEAFVRMNRLNKFIEIIKEKYFKSYVGIHEPTYIVLRDSADGASVISVKT